MLQFQEKTLKSMQSIADDMENARADLEISAKMDSCNIYQAADSIKRAAASTGKIYRKLIALQDSLGIPSQYEKASAANKALQIEKIGDIYHFVLLEMLPHRITFDKFSQKLRYDYDTNIYYAGYRAVAEEYIANNPIDPFKRKVMLAIVSHAGKLDNDNIEIKTFIDAAIKGIFVLDDSPAYLSLYLDTIEDTREYTEMFLGDPSIILQTYLHII